METIVANLVGAVRRVTWHGRSYLVAPMTMIVPGVLPGSEGPILYSETVVNQDPDSWNGMPIVVNHPTITGPDGVTRHISARSPEVLEKFGIGTVFNATTGGKLGAEAWFDEERTRKLAPAYLSLLEAGRPGEVSTGLILHRVPADAGAVHNGIPYNHVATGYTPDHLAILPDKVGACSTKDGCGVLVNEEQKGLITTFLEWLRGQAATVPPTPIPSTSATTNEDAMKLTAAQRTAIIDHLVTNCDCWKFKGDKEVLANFSDEKLVKLRKEIDDTSKFSKLAAALTVNAQGDTASGANLAELATFLGVTIDPATDPAGYIGAILSEMDTIRTKLTAAVVDDPEDVNDLGADEATEDTGAMTTTGAPVMNKLLQLLQGKKPTANKKAPPAPPKQKTVAEFMAEAPPEVRAIVVNGAKADKKAKEKLAGQLTAHVKDPALKARLIANHMKKDVDILEDEVAALPPPAQKSPDGLDGLPNYFGAGGGPTGNATPEMDEDDILPLPHYDPREGASKFFSRQA